MSPRGPRHEDNAGTSDGEDIEAAARFCRGFSVHPRRRPPATIVLTPNLRARVFLLTFTLECEIDYAFFRRYFDVARSDD